MSDLFARRFLKEVAPTNSGGDPQAYSNAAAADGPVAGFDKKLFPSDIDLLDQGYQTAGETGLSKWRFSNVYPVMKVTLDDNDGEGPSIDAMVHASKEFVTLMDKNTQDYVKKRFSSFMEETKESKQCPDGQYWCYNDKKCKTIPRGYHIGRSGYLAHDKKNGNGNGNGNGSHNGNGNGNGNGGGNGGGNGNGGGGNGGGGE